MCQCRRDCSYVYPHNTGRMIPQMQLGPGGAVSGQPLILSDQQTATQPCRLRNPFFPGLSEDDRRYTCRNQKQHGFGRADWCWRRRSLATFTTAHRHPHTHPPSTTTLRAGSRFACIDLKPVWFGLKAYHPLKITSIFGIFFLEPFVLVMLYQTGSCFRHCPSQTLSIGNDEEGWLSSKLLGPAHSASSLTNSLC